MILYPKYLNIIFLIVLIIWSLSSLIFKSYKVSRTSSHLKALEDVSKTLILFSLLFFIYLTMNESVFFKFREFVRFILILSLFQLTFAFIKFDIFYKYRLNGKNFRNVLIVDPILDKDGFEKLVNHGLHFGYKFIAHLKKLNDLDKSINKISKSKKIDIIFWAIAIKKHLI